MSLATGRYLLDAIAGSLPSLDGGQYVVAYSGGVDSTALLHYLANVCAPGTVRAVHVQHDLQPAAPDWARQCRAGAAALHVPIIVCPVHVNTDTGGSPEAAARAARYAALAAQVYAHDVLITGHHADDQAQTFLLQALRGAGVHGLAAMPALADFGNGRHARPMLSITRDQIVAYARAHELEWVEDPSNSDASLDRSYLNKRIWPLIREHWPAAATTLTRSAGWCAESAELDETRATQDTSRCRGAVSGCLSVERIAILPRNRARSVLREWLKEHALPPPRLCHLERIESDCVNAAADAQPCVSWRGGEVRRYRGQLYAMRPLSSPDRHWSATWQPPEALPLPADGGRLVAERCPGGLAPGHCYKVYLRQGGEHLQLPGRNHQTTLKKALQRAGVPPWLRERVPLIVAENRIAAVAGLWICEPFAVRADMVGWQPLWLDSPPGWPDPGEAAFNRAPKIR